MRSERVGLFDYCKPKFVLCFVAVREKKKHWRDSLLSQNFFLAFAIIHWTNSRIFCFCGISNEAVSKSRIPLSGVYEKGTAIIIDRFPMGHPCPLCARGLPSPFPPPRLVELPRYAITNIYKITIDPYGLSRLFRYFSIISLMFRETRV